jgi:ribonuclease HII
VVAAGVILPPNFHHPEIDDSKALNPAKRLKLYSVIVDNAVAYSFGFVNHRWIDEINVLQATILAMRKAVMSLATRPELVVTDAVHIPELPYPQENVVGGDRRSISVAAASILAKVRRDRVMVNFHRIYPQYNFEVHKGYATRKHRAAILQYGPCPIHRKTFKLI